MSKGKALLRNTLIYSIGSFGSKVLSFALLPIYSYYLTKEELGIYDLILTTISLAVPIISLQLTQANYRWLLEAKTIKEKRKSVSTSFFILTLFICFFIGVYLFTSKYLNIPYKFYFIFLLITTSYYYYFQDISRGLKRNKLYSITGIIYSVCLLLLVTFLLIILKWQIEGILVASIVAYIIAITWVIFKVKAYNLISVRSLSKLELRKMIKYSIPLIPTTISWWLISASNRYIILWILGPNSNGIFAISTRFPEILNIINSIFIMAWQDHTIQDKENDTSFSKKTFDLYFRMELGIAIVFIAGSKYIVKYLFSNDFIDSWRYMGILFIATVFSALSAYYGAAYLREKKTKGLLTTTFYGGITNVIFSLLFIKHIGLYAPAIGSLLGQLIIYLTRLYQTRSFFSIEYNKRLFIFLSFFAVAAILLALLNKLYIDIILIICSFILFFYLNKETIIKLKGISQNYIKKI